VLSTELFKARVCRRDALDRSDRVCKICKIEPVEERRLGLHPKTQTPGICMSVKIFYILQVYLSRCLGSVLSSPGHLEACIKVCLLALFVGLTIFSDACSYLVRFGAGLCPPMKHA
jgi:hypothetical protein